jgi:hypothetical protein
MAIDRDLAAPYLTVVLSSTTRERPMHIQSEALNAST